MYIQPSSTLILLKGCPCDPDYNNTLYFVSAGLQEAYFKTLAKYTFSDLSYIRVNRGEIRVEKKTEDLYDCNYMMFQNTAFGEKWFYAFVKSVDYVSNTTASIKFEIDEIQTWYFETNFRDCFIERTHTVTDNPGENLVPENLQLGEYNYEDVPGIDWGPSIAIGESVEHFLILATFIKENSNYRDSAGQNLFANYSGLTVSHVIGAQNLISFVSGAIEAHKDEGIKAIYKIPRKLGEAFDTYKDSLGVANIEYAVPANYGSKFGSYTPKNNKLYTWPYYGLYITNNEGVSATFPFEYFILKSNAARFSVLFAASPIPVAALCPDFYKKSGLKPVNYNEKMELTPAMYCSWTTDTFAKYMADRFGTVGIMSDIALSVASSPINSTRAGGLAYAGSVIDSLAVNAYHSLMEVYRAKVQPDQSHGQSTNDLNALSGEWCFTAYRVRITEEFARIIDGYFDQFGYAINTVGTPSRKNRPHWTFIKTKGCTLSGSIPSDSVRRICDIHDKGITYWSNPEEVGDYSIDNSPAGELPPTPPDPVDPSTPENFIPRLSEDGILNNPYWYKDNIYYQEGYGMPNCTCYALGRWYEIQGSSTPFNFPGYWDGMDWFEMCEKAGYQTSKDVPMLGACMSWKHGSAGHVAIVEQIKYNEDGTVYSVITSNSGWQGDFWYPQEILASNGWKYRDDQTFNGFGYHPSLTAKLTGGETNGAQEP